MAFTLRPGEDVHQLVQRMQAHSGAMRDQPIEVVLSSQPGPYELPPCKSAAVGILPSGTPGLILDTENDQRIFVPLSLDLLGALGRTITFALTPRKE
jgi:hypothetical protein